MDGQVKNNAFDGPQDGQQKHKNVWFYQTYRPTLLTHPNSSLTFDLRVNEFQRLATDYISGSSDIGVDSTTCSNFRQI